jgi:hypothetical protein
MRTVARTAVVAGTATAVSNRVSRRQANRWSEQGAADQQQYSEPPPAAPGVDPVAQLRQLAELKEQGILTEAEFTAEKAKILSST